MQLIYYIYIYPGTILDCRERDVLVKAYALQKHIFYKRRLFYNYVVNAIKELCSESMRLQKRGAYPNLTRYGKARGQR